MKKLSDEEWRKWVWDFPGLVGGVAAQNERRSVKKLSPSAKRAAAAQRSRLAQQRQRRAAMLAANRAARAMVLPDAVKQRRDKRRAHMQRRAEAAE